MGLKCTLYCYNAFCHVEYPCNSKLLYQLPSVLTCWRNHNDDVGEEENIDR